jgi:S1-C subfamily serine protease
MRRLGATLLLIVAALLGGCAGGTNGPERSVAIQPTYPGGAIERAAFPNHEVVVRQAFPTYVRVLVYDRYDEEGMPEIGVLSGASGVIADPRGYVVTAAHIARNTRHRVRVTGTDGRIHEGRILHVDPSQDLAVVKIAPFAGMRVAPFTDSRHLAAGDPAFVIGTPDNKPGRIALGRVAVPRMKQRVVYGEFGFDNGIELQADVQPGHSGGPVFDGKGRLIGILAGFGLGDTSQEIYVPTYIGYAMPSTRVAAYLSVVAGSAP